MLKYRLARERDSRYQLATHVRQDAYRAMRLVRSRAAEWHVDPERVGMLGFSAGGEVVAMVAYTSGFGDPNAADPIDRQNGRPNFQMIVYPGPLGIPNEGVPADSPPLFIVCANDDQGHIEPTIDLVNKYRAARAPVEAHIYSHGGHAFNMGRRSELATLKGWPVAWPTGSTTTAGLSPATAGAIAILCQLNSAGLARTNQLQWQ